MVFKIVTKFCSVTASQKGWEVELPMAFSTKDEAEQYLKANAEQLMSSAPGFGMLTNRILFRIKEDGGW